MTTQELAYTEIERLVKDFKCLRAPHRKGMNEMQTAQERSVRAIHSSIGGPLVVFNALSLLLILVIKPSKPRKWKLSILTN
jgi:hypothetical protein